MPVVVLHHLYKITFLIWRRGRLAFLGFSRPFVGWTLILLVLIFPFSSLLHPLTGPFFTGVTCSLLTGLGDRVSFFPW